MWFLGNRKHEQEEQEAVAFARTLPARIEPSAKDIMARACNMLDWIDHLELEPGEPLPANLILSDGRAPWENLPKFEDGLPGIMSMFDQSRQMDSLAARERLSALHSAGDALRASATDLLTAEIAVGADRAGTAKASFESARKHARHAASRAEEAMAPLPTEPILEGGAVLMTTEDPCDAL